MINLFSRLIGCMILFVLLLFASLTYGEEGHTLPATDLTGNMLSEKTTIYVENYLFKGNTVFSDKTLLTLVKDYQNRVISPEELQEVKHLLTRYYIDNGYINSGVIIPDQDIKNGLITLEVIEGRLDKITITGNTSLSTNYIKKRLIIKEEIIPLNIIKLRERLRLLRQDVHIKNIHAQLAPGTNPGSSELDVKIVENRRMKFTSTLSNHASPDTGSIAFDNDLSLFNLSGWGDDLTLTTRLSEGLKRVGLYYSIPVTYKNILISAETEMSESEVVSEPFNELDITGESTQAAFSLRYPLYRTVSKEVASSIKFSYFKSTSFLSGDRFSFSEWASDGEIRISTLRLNQEFISRSLNQVFALRLTENFGIDPFDEKTGQEGLDNDFISLQGQCRYVRRLAFKESEFQLNLNFQYSSNELPSSERFSAGGAASVRGYRENSMSTDSGAVLSASLKIPFFDLRIPYISRKAGDGLISFVPFLDCGAGTHNDSSTDSETIGGAGVGFIWGIGENLDTEIFIGKSFTDKETVEYDIQDDGIYFKIQAKF